MARKQPGPVFPNYREALRAAFGDSADRIPGVDPAAGCGSDVPVYGLHAVLQFDGRAFVSCGMAEVFGAMESAEPASKLVFYLVRDDSAGENWARLRDRIDAAHAAWREGRGGAVAAADWRDYHAGRPAPQYKVVASI
jgi:hypothetical protein